MVWCQICEKEDYYSETSMEEEAWEKYKIKPFGPLLRSYPL